jgi:hypothetical protein
VIGSIIAAGTFEVSVPFFWQAGHADRPGGKRRPQSGHFNRVSHSGQTFQFSLTSIPQPGHVSRPSGASQAGHTFQVPLTASPQAGQLDSVFTPIDQTSLQTSFRASLI